MDSREEAVLFYKWLPQDPRTYKDHELESKYSDFKKEYACAYCGRFFEEMSRVWRLNKTSVRFCDNCNWKKQEKDKLISDFIQEWRYNEEDLEFIPYGKSHDDIEEQESGGGPK
jgi:hypothetical protein